MEINTSLSQLDYKVKRELFSKLFIFVWFVIITTFIMLFIMVSEVKKDKIKELNLFETIIQYSDNELINRNILRDYNIVYYYTLENDVIFERNNIVLTNGQRIGFKNNKLVYVMKFNNIFFIFLLYGIFMILISSFLFYYWTVKLSAKSRVNEMMNNVGKEAALANKNMNILTENISHEAKTPLMIISSSIQEIKNNMFKLSCNNCIIFDCAHNRVIDNSNVEKISRTFDLLEMNVESIYNIIERIRDFKKVKYSNGNKSIFNIAHASRNIMHLYKKIKFEIELDCNLKNYKLERLKNEDLMNIFTNHIKNSVEAKSTSIIINAGEIEDGLLPIYIIDNGNGIPKNIATNIFEANFSTKETGDIRGVGLYLSKELLNSIGGKTSLYETSLDGTAFELKIPAEKIN